MSPTSSAKFNLSPSPTANSPSPPIYTKDKPSPSLAPSAIPPEVASRPSYPPAGVPIPANRPPLSASIDPPQLSERDSIFATTYLPSTSPPPLHQSLLASPSSRFHGVQASDGQLPVAGATGGTVTSQSSISSISSISPQLSTPRRSYSSTQRTPSSIYSRQSLPKRHFSRPISSTAPRLPLYNTAPMGSLQDEEMGLSRSPLASPIQFSSSPTELENNIITPLSADEEAERIRYRSWREGNPDLKKSPIDRTARSMSRDAHKLSRKIQATLPKTDGQPISSRSRKSSQYLGLFKEKPTAQEQQPRRPRPRQKSTKEEVKKEITSQGWQSNPVSPRQRQMASPVIQQLNETAESDAPGVFQALSHGGPQYRHASTSTISSSRSHPDLQALVVLGSKIDLSPQSPRPRTREGQVRIPSLNNFQLPPPAEDLDQRSRRELKMRRQNNFIPSVESAPDTDDEDSVREHISSAMYYPHRQVRPDMSPELEGAVRPTVGRTQSATVSIDQHEDTTVNNSIIHPSGRSEEVEISLESADDQQLWKGDYPVAPESVDRAIELKSGYDEQEADSSMSDFESHDESTASTVGYDSEEDEILESSTTTPKAPQTRLVRKHHSRHPLGAVELKPFNHQVGGHSTVYQFSRRAVCKKLNNRENVFYETVEKYHPELLEFMPRYIGVVNVTYSRVPRRKRTKSSFSGDQISLRHISQSLNQAIAPETSEIMTQEEQPRIVSHSQQQQQNGPPQVIFENNRHIIPANLFKVPSRPTTPDPPYIDSKRSPINNGHKPLNPIESVSHDGSPKPQIKQWGSTYVNRKLQEQVLREVFAPPLIHRHRHARRQHLETSEVPPQRSLGTNSTPASYQNANAFRYSFMENKASNSLDSGDTPEPDIGVPLHSTLTGPIEDAEYIEQNSVSNSVTPSVGHRTIRRRHSGGGLRRRPLDVVSGTRTDLEFHEKEPSPDRDDGVFSLDMEPLERKRSFSKSKSRIVIDGITKSSGNIGIPVRLQAVKELSELPSTLPNPRNPVQARIQPDERNEMFILLEDLTSRMRHPCVLDLKMGTRQYGVEADERKQRSQRRKCAVTTSLKLGVRVCGMQVWNVKTQSYIFEDKYFGRDLKAGAEFQSALTRFFFDGLGYASALRFIPVILEKLARMERMIRDVPGYRFYASSLLILYDRGSSDDSLSSSPEPSSPKNAHTAPPHFVRSDSGPPKPLSRPPRKSARPSPIKIKIVDFANCVTAEDTERLTRAPLPPKNPGDVDRGYLRGLRTLRIYFQRIWKELSEEEWVERGEGEGMALGQRGAGRGTASKSGWEDAVPFEDPGDVSV